MLVDTLNRIAPCALRGPRVRVVWVLAAVLTLMASAAHPDTNASSGGGSVSADMRPSVIDFMGYGYVNRAVQQALPKQAPHDERVMFHATINELMNALVVERGFIEVRRTDVPKWIDRNKLQAAADDLNSTIRSEVGYAASAEDLQRVFESYNGVFPPSLRITRDPMEQGIVTANESADGQDMAYRDGVLSPANEAARLFQPERSWLIDTPNEAEPAHSAVYDCSQLKAHYPHKSNEGGAV